MNAPKSDPGSQPIGRINRDGLKGKRYPQNQGSQPLPPTEPVTPAENSGRAGTNFPDTNASGRLRDQTDRPIVREDAANDRKLPGVR